MIRGILNWLAANLGPATTPEEVAALVELRMVEPPKCDETGCDRPAAWAAEYGHGDEYYCKVRIGGRSAHRSRLVIYRD